MAGAVCLLLWGSFTVRSAVERRFASTLNTFIGGGVGNGPRAVIGGVLSALVLQSATATILLATALLTSGILTLPAAMGVILGADLGSALATRILFLDLGWLPPGLMVAGMSLHLLGNTWRLRYLGRICIGVALMLLAILWIKTTMAPVAAQPLPGDWLSVLSSAPWIALPVMAIATWFAHSSVALVLLVATLAHSGVLPQALYLPMLLGINFGAGLIPLPTVGRRNLDGRAVVLTNLVLRGGLAVLSLAALPLYAGYLSALDTDPGVKVVLGHIIFNFVLAVVFLPISGRLAIVMRRWLGDRAADFHATEMSAPGSALDRTLVADPERAVAAARREANRMGDITEALFARALEMFEADDHVAIERMVLTDRDINARNKTIHRYLSEVRRHVVAPQQEQHIDAVLQFAATMENIGDIVSHNLSRLASKKLDRAANFTSEGMDEIFTIHREVLNLLRREIDGFAGAGIMSSGQASDALEQIRQLCDQSMSRHRRRLSEHRARSIGSSSIHQDTIRDLLQVAALLVNRPSPDHDVVAR